MTARVDVELRPFPAESRMRWRRIDVRGHESARIARTPAGWELAGQLEAQEQSIAARLEYVIKCDADWRTRTALVMGEADGRPVQFAIAVDATGQWTLGGIPQPALAGAIDVDLGFTPATNTLPIRRLLLEVGESAAVKSAWLRFPELRLEPLEQTYTRHGAHEFSYEAVVDGAIFRARLDTDAFGRVLRYEGLWEAELAEPAS